MYDWSVFPPTLLATVTGATFAAGTSWLLAWKAGQGRHRELMSERVRSVVETLIEWNAAERHHRDGGASGVPTAAEVQSWDDAKVNAASASLLLSLEARGDEQKVASAVRGALSRIDYLGTHDERGDAMTEVNEALERWWTGASKLAECQTALDGIAPEK